MRGKIAKEDNYKAIPELTPNMTYLDSVILSKIYNIDDEAKQIKNQL